MAISQLVMALNVAGTLSIGVITFLIVYTTFKGLEDKVIQDFSKRFLMAISILLLYVSYLMAYYSFFRGSTMARYPLFLLLVVVFIYLIYAAVGFEKIAESYGMSEDSKLDKMENEERMR